jgi:hypothetical protein
MSRAKAPDLVGRRARVAAACLLSAFDLPAEMIAASKQLLQACRVCPGLTVRDVPVGSRRQSLHAARQIIDQLLEEGGDE